MIVTKQTNIKPFILKLKAHRVKKPYEYINLLRKK